MLSWYFLFSFRCFCLLVPTLKITKKTPALFSGKSLFILSRPLFHRAVSLIYFHPSPPQRLAADSPHASWIPSRPRRKPPKPPRLCLPPCVMRILIIAVRCHGAHATPSLEPSRYRGRARREGGVDGSGCPLLRCVIGALLHL